MIVACSTEIRSKRSHVPLRRKREVNVAGAYRATWRYENSSNYRDYRAIQLHLGNKSLSLTDVTVCPFSSEHRTVSLPLLARRYAAVSFALRSGSANTTAINRGK